VGELIADIRSAEGDEAVAGIGDPGREAEWVTKFSLAPITDAGYSISVSISPCHGHSSELLTNPARTGFSFT